MAIRKLRTLYWAIVLLFGHLVALIFTPEVLAQSPTSDSVVVKGIEQHDLDGDGSPDQTIILCSFATEDDRVLVLDGAGDMTVSNDWQGTTDFDDDTWIFDVGTDGSAELIVVFSSDGGGHVARFYDDTDGDGKVAYHVVGTQVIIDESAYWSLEMTAESGWYTSTGHPNMNVKALLDKPYSGFQSMTQDIASRYMVHDGVPDVTFELTDSNRDGVPEHYLVRLLSFIPEKVGVGRSNLYFNDIGTQPVPPRSARFWPFLALQQPGSSEVLRYFDMLPAVSVDWKSSEIRGLIWKGYPIGAGYHINNMQHIHVGETNEADFEVPHAYYDLAANKDAFPELNIRLFRMLPDPWQEVRYSWNQTNPGTLLWDYKLGLMSDHPIDQVVGFPTFELRMVSYELLPYWVTGREWKLTTFVAREGGSRESTEGIYAWTPREGADPTSPDNPSMDAHYTSTSYLTGDSDIAPYEYFTDIWEGYRGEYNLAQPLRPLLYYSPIDHRLHLRGAERGLLNLGQNRQVTYQDTNGDGYLDHWQYLESGVVRRQLIHAKPYLLHAANGGVALKSEDEDFSVFETLPPRDHEDWLALGQHLEAYHLDLAPDDLGAMLAQFQGPEWRVEGAELRSFRPDGGGFRFVLDLHPGFVTSGSGGPDLSGLPAGAYVLQYDDTFNVKPLTPARLEVAPGTFRLSVPEPVALEPVWIEARLRNQGLEDVPELSVRAYAKESGGQRELVAEEEITLLAGESLPVRLEWYPFTPGRWWLTLELSTTPDSELIPTPVRAQTSLDVLVTSPPPPSAAQIWKLSNADQPLTLLLILTTVALTAASLLLIGVRRAERHP